MIKKRKMLPFYFCLIFILVFSQVINIYGLDVVTSTPSDVQTQTSTPAPTATLPASYIAMDLDKNNAAVGEIITVKVKVQNIDGFAGCLTNIKYDPAVLKPVNPETGIDFLDYTKPLNGTIILNDKYSPQTDTKYNFTTGTLYIDRYYNVTNYYRQSGICETTGTVYELGFKVLPTNATSTDIKFTPTDIIPNAPNGVELFNWNSGYVPRNYAVIQPSSIQIGGPTPTPPSSYITMELDKTQASIDDIITAEVKVQNIADFAGLQANIKYDPTLFKPIDPISGTEYTSSTKPGDGNILINKNYSPYLNAQNDTQNGIINFSRGYADLYEYKSGGMPETSGTVAVISFKVINAVNRDTYIYFENTSTMPDSNIGSFVFDWDGSKLKSGYSVIEPSKISILNSSPTPKPSSADSFITLDLDKTNAGVGDIIKASVRINDLNNFYGYQANIIFDPSVLEAVNPVTGAAFDNRTKPLNGNILLNTDYSIYSIAVNDLSSGILNFARGYSDWSAYRASGAPETTGITAVIGFRVISSNVSTTSIRFEDTPSMPNAVTGTLSFDWFGNRLTDYTVIQAPVINIYPYSPPPTVSPRYKISGYITPDFEIGANQSTDIKAGFKVEVVGTSYTVQTDNNGYFEIADIPYRIQGYTLRISKDNYLYRIINNIAVIKDVEISSSDSPLAIWAGDIKANGVQDNVINMSDIMEVARGFNTSVSDQRYNGNYDINQDNAINMVDILIFAKHFNRTVNDYPNLKYL